MKLLHALSFSLLFLAQACGAESFEEEEIATDESALNATCSDQAPDMTFAASYAGANIKGGFADTNGYVRGTKCNGGFFVQLNAWKPEPVLVHQQRGTLYPQLANVSQADCSGIRSRLYVWAKHAGGTFSYVGGYSQNAFWTDGSCRSTVDISSEDALERILNQSYMGETVKYAITANKADGTVISVKMGANDI
ncbi:MAG TPA: hypothetical protein VHM70_28185 [Polyangiaceae bacterium]|jgi:hypothetical protein|nr:hypothetical protein [Polyangiaceae bacterium]